MRSWQLAGWEDKKLQIDEAMIDCFELFLQQQESKMTIAMPSRINYTDFTIVPASHPSVAGSIEVLDPSISSVEDRLVDDEDNSVDASENSDSVQELNDDEVHDDETDSLLFGGIDNIDDRVVMYDNELFGHLPEAAQHLRQQWNVLARKRQPPKRVCEEIDYYLLCQKVSFG